jgi:pimeloyl-ACP methyl ester carboxylesterase
VLLPLVAEKLEITLSEIPDRFIAWGHSLGAAAALIIADDAALRRTVVFSPFTSTMDMAQHQFKVPLGFLLRHRFDNKARVLAIRARGGELWIGHGTEDEIIPVEMGRHLAFLAEAPGHYTEMLDGRHNDIFFTHPMVLHELMRRASGISHLTPEGLGR